MPKGALSVPTVCWAQLAHVSDRYYTQGNRTFIRIRTVKMWYMRETSMLEQKCGKIWHNVAIHGGIPVNRSIKWLVCVSKSRRCVKISVRIGWPWNVLQDQKKCAQFWVHTIQAQLLYWSSRTDRVFRMEHFEDTLAYRWHQCSALDLRSSGRWAGTSQNRCTTPSQHSQIPGSSHGRDRQSSQHMS